MKNTILCISDSDKQFSSAILEYKKRMKHIEIIDLKPVKTKSPPEIIKKETTKLIEKIEQLRKKRTFSNVLLLSIGGKIYSTEELTQKIPKGSTNLFVIGGPYGYDEELLSQYAIGKISFGKITLPHGLAKLVLIEQLYRIGTIHTGKKYHY